MLQLREDASEVGVVFVVVVVAPEALQRFMGREEDRMLDGDEDLVGVVGHDGEGEPPSVVESYGARYASIVEMSGLRGGEVAPAILDLECAEGCVFG